MSAHRTGSANPGARARASRVIALLLSAALWGSCLDFSATAPDQLLYLTFDKLPYPSVVLGDTLRDSTGLASTLSATAVGGDGSALQTAPLRYYAVDDTSKALRVDSVGATVVSVGTRSGAVKLVASVGGIQSPPLLLLVTSRPDSLHLSVTSDTIEFSFTDTTVNISDPLSAKVLHHDSAAAYSATRGWVVRYSLESLEDTVSAWLVDDQNLRMRGVSNGSRHADTSGVDGEVARRLRIRPGPPLSGGLDSVAVRIDATYKGVHLAGSPARVFVYTRPRISP